MNGVFQNLRPGLYTISSTGLPLWCVANAFYGMTMKPGRAITGILKEKKMHTNSRHRNS